jgi:hypothetical protein
MEIDTISDIYSPSIDEFGNYIDKLPNFNIITNGIKCSCGSRKNQIYTSNNIFNAHIKTKKHIAWLLSLNLNKHNYYKENKEFQETIYRQRILIAQIDRQLNQERNTSFYLQNEINRYIKLCVDNNINNSIPNNIMD